MVTSFPSLGGLTSSLLTNQKTPGQAQKHRSLLTSAHPVSIPCIFSTETTGIFYFPSSAGHLLLYPEDACPPIILLATKRVVSFIHPIFSLVIPLATSLLVSFPHSAPLGSVRPSILILYKILRMVLPLYSTYFLYTTPYPCPQYYLTRSIP